MTVWLPLFLWTILTCSRLLCNAGHTGYDSIAANQVWPRDDSGQGFRLFDKEGEEDIVADSSPNRGEYLPEWRELVPKNEYFDDSGEGRSIKAIKREGHSLSIVNPLDVLRQRLMLEMARRRMKVNQEQIRENELLLKNLGKRATPQDRTVGFKRHQVTDFEDFEV